MQSTSNVTTLTMYSTTVSPQNSALVVETNGVLQTVGYVVIKVNSKLTTHYVFFPDCVGSFAYTKVTIDLQCTSILHCLPLVCLVSLIFWHMHNVILCLWSTDNMVQGFLYNVQQGLHCNSS